MKKRKEEHDYLETNFADINLKINYNDILAGNFASSAKCYLDELQPYLLYQLNVWIYLSSLPSHRLIPTYLQEGLVQCM